MNKKSKSLAYLLWLFGGWFGAHNFYSGEKIKAIVKILCLVALLIIIIIDAYAVFFVPIIVLLILCIIDMFTLGKIIDKYNAKENPTSVNNEKHNEVEFKIINEENVEMSDEKKYEIINETNIVNKKGDFMASWDEVKEYIDEKYPGKKDDDTLITTIQLEEISQTIIFQKKTDTKEGVWLNILAPTGELSSWEKIDHALKLLSFSHCGGLIKLGDRYFIRHSVHIGEISVNEIGSLFNNVCAIAISLKKELKNIDES